MTELLEQAFAAASKLSPQEQNAIAYCILTEMESEQRWSELLAKSQDKLAQLAEEALKEHRAGLTRPL